MFYDKIASLVDTNFSDWLLKEMNKRGWSQADLARASGLNRQSVSDYVNLRRTNPEPEALVSLANAFKLPPETVFRAAGLLPQQTEETEIIQQISHLTKELPKHEQQYDKLLPLVADAVIQAIQTYKNDPAAIDSTEHITDKIHAQQTLRQRVQEAMRSAYTTSSKRKRK